MTPAMASDDAASGEAQLTISLELIETLRQIDTPSVCNALEYLNPARRRIGFNRVPLICPFPDLKPVVGFARTAIIHCLSLIHI